MMLPVLIYLALAAAPAEALKPLYFKIEVNTDRVHTALGCVEVSSDERTFYDRARFDLDGDGELEKIVTLEKGRRRISEDYLSTSIAVPLGGKDWQVDLSGKRAAASTTQVYVNWCLNQDGVYFFFINGKAKLHASLEEARKGKAIRLGPPFRFDTRTTTRGPAALVNVGLKDENGCTLRIAAKTDGGDREESNIHLTFLKSGSTIKAEYG